MQMLVCRKAQTSAVLAASRRHGQMEPDCDGVLWSILASSAARDIRTIGSPRHCFTGFCDALATKATLIMRRGFVRTATGH